MFGAVTAVSLLVAVGAVIWARREVAIARRELERFEAERALLGSGRGAVKAAIQTVVRVRDHGLGGALRGSIEDLAGWAEVEQPDLRRLAARDGTVTILFSDIEDSTALNESLGDRGWMKILSAHDAVIRRRVEGHHGHIVKSQGDGFMVAFASPAEAVSCAVEVQRSFAAGPRRLRKNPIRVRIGIHVGSAVTKDGDLFGRNVAMAARVAAAAGGAEVLVSSPVAERAADLEGISIGSPREVELKGLPGRHQLFRVEWDAVRDTP